MTEVINESIGLIMGYCYLMLMNIVSESEIRKWLGLSIVAASAVLISINVFQLGKTIFHKTKIKYNKYKYEKINYSNKFQ